MKTSSGMSSETIPSKTTPVSTDYCFKEEEQPYSEKPDQPIDNLILADHQVVRKIYDKFKSAVSREDADKWRNQLVYEVAVHSLAEEIVLYPVIRDQLPNGQMLFNQSIEEHKEVKENLYKAQNVDIYSDDFRFRVKEVMDALFKHISKEEEEILPLLDKHISLNKRIELGNMFARRKLIVPTKPHPSLPMEPTTVNSILGLLTAPIDKFRDLFSSFPESQKMKDIKQDASSKASVSSTSEKKTSSSM